MRLSTANFRDRLLPITLGQLVGVGCGLVSVKVVSHLVPPATFGVYGVFLTFTTLGMWLIHAGVIRFAGRHWAGAADRGGMMRTLARAWAKKLVWLALATAGVSILVSRFELTASFLLFLPLFVASGLLSVCSLIQTSQQAARAHWPDFLVSSIGSATRSFVPPLLYFAVGGIGGLYLGFCLHAAFTAVAGLVSLRRYWKPASEAATPQVTPVYDGPLFGAIALAGWILAGLNRWLTASAFGETEAGLFNLANNIAQILPAVLGAIFLQFTQPGFYALADSGEPDAFRRLAKRVDLTVLSFGTGCLAALIALRLVAPWLLGWLIDERYAAALNWIIPAGCFSLTTMAGYFYHVILLAGRREKDCAYVDLTTAAILATAVTTAAFAGQNAFWWTLTLSPVLIPCVTRQLARSRLLRNQAEPPMPSPAP